MTDAISTAAYGMQTAMRSYAAHAEKIASADSAVPPATPSGYAPATVVHTITPNIDVPSEVVGAIQAAASFRANLAVFKAGMHLGKALLDTSV